MPPEEIDDAAAAIDETASFVSRQLTPLQEVSATAASTLATLARSGPCRLTELATVEGVRSPSMSALISRLEQQGFARRSTDASDGRVVLVAITEEGEHLLARRRSARMAFLSHLLSGLPSGQQRHLAQAVPALRGLIDPPAVPAALDAARRAVVEEGSAR